MGGGQKKRKKKALKMTSQLVILRAFFISPEKQYSNQLSVLNLEIIHHFSKNPGQDITFNSVTLKNTQT